MNRTIKLLLYLILLFLSFLLVPLAVSILEPVMRITPRWERESLPVSQDILSRESSDVCSDPLLLEDPYFKQLMDSYLKVWHKFVPDRSKMDSSNCWYVKNVDLRLLPTNLTEKMKTWVDLTNLTEKIPLVDRIADVETLLDSTFIYGNTAEFSQQPTAYHFCLPSVNLMGYTKASSTLFYDYIRSHPMLAQPQMKEPQLWREITEMNDAKYRELLLLLYLYLLFDASNQIEDNPDMFTIDASVSNVFATSKPLRKPEIDVCIVPLLIHQTMPNTKFLTIMRHPIKRLWSEFLFYCYPSKWDKNEHLKGLAKTPFVVASVFHNYTVRALHEFNACIESGNTEIHCTALSGSYCGHRAECQRVRIGISMYYIHLVKWFNVFPRQQLHMLRLEDLVSDPFSTMDRVWAFLDRPFNAEFETIKRRVNPNPWRAIGNGTEFKMFPETKKLLQDFYHPYNVKLAKLLNDERFLWTES